MYNSERLLQRLTDSGRHELDPESQPNLAQSLAWLPTHSDPSFIQSLQVLGKTAGQTYKNDYLANFVKYQLAPTIW